MIRRPPRSTRTDTLFPYTTLFRSFGGGVFALAILPRLAIDRTYIDDATKAARLHPFEDHLGHVEAATKIDVNHLVPVLMGQLQQRGIASDTRVVDEHVNGTDVCLDLPEAVLTGLVIADLPFEHPNAGARKSVVWVKRGSVRVCTGG